MTFTHDGMVREIIARASRHGVLAHYCRNSRTCDGSAGLPDLILAGPYGTVFIEVKAGYDVPVPARATWHHMLKAGGETVHVVRERYLNDGSLDLILADLSSPVQAPGNVQYPDGMPALWEGMD